MKNTILILGSAIALSFFPQAFGNEQALRGSYSICYDQDGRPCNGFHKQKMPDGGTYEIMYKNGKANGKGELTRPDGSKIKTQFINGHPTGKTTEFYPSGKLASECHFSNGIADGECKSYYENVDYCGEESDFYYVSAYAPKGVVCLLSAAVYYHLTTFIPDAVEVAIPRKAKISTIPDWPPMKIHYYTDDRYKLGTLTVREDKNEFRIYDIEKTVVDIVFYREKVGIEETREILINYLKRKERDLNRLLKYAELMKCDKVLRHYLEMLI